MGLSSSGHRGTTLKPSFGLLGCVATRVSNVKFRVQERFEALEAAKLAVEGVCHSTQAAVEHAEAELRVVTSAAAVAADEGSARAQEQLLIQEKLQVRSYQFVS